MAAARQLAMPAATVAGAALTAAVGYGASRRLASTAAANGHKRKVVVTAALNGVLTDPAKFNVPVTPAEMAAAAKEAHNAGASIVHIHFRDQRKDQGAMPSWDPQVAADVVEAIRAACPVIVNMTTGTVGNKGPMGGGSLGPTDGPIACMDACKPEMAALNSGSLNYLKAGTNGWAWPPILFDNPVKKIETMLNAMRERSILPECECFDAGIVRSIGMFEKVGLLSKPYQVALVMGVASGLPAKADWLPLLIKELPQNAIFQVTAIGRSEVWPLLRACVQHGGNVRTGLEDTFYLPDGSQTTSNGKLVDALVKIVREEGCEPASVAETRQLLQLK